MRGQFLLLEVLLDDEQFGYFLSAWIHIAYGDRGCGGVTERVCVVSGVYCERGWAMREECIIIVNVLYSVVLWSIALSASPIVSVTSAALFQFKNRYSDMASPCPFAGDNPWGSYYKGVVTGYHIIDGVIDVMVR